jgi:chemotaxis protein CheX
MAEHYPNADGKNADGNNTDGNEYRLELPAILDIAVASQLQEALLARRGAPLVVRGAAVQRLGAQCVQILLAARNAWAADNHMFRLVDGSEELFATLALLGVAPESLNAVPGGAA